MASRRVANAIFCDDIRVELGNKLSLMGVYASDILFPVAPPFTFPKFGVVAWIIMEKDDVPNKFVLRVLMPPDRTELARIELEGEPAFTTEPDEFSKHVIIKLAVPMANVTFLEDGYMEIMVDIENEETFRAGRLRVRSNVKPEEMGIPAA